jgi:NAD(P)-dependent dehydrogenase (short-subunit alcohol dehydrogenase family)
MRRIVISGVSRGLGREFCIQYLYRGEAVVGLCRSLQSCQSLIEYTHQTPQRLHLVELDVTDFDSVLAFGQQISGLPVDLLINNAGQIGPETHKGEAGQSVRDLNPDILDRLFKVNALAPLILTSALIPSLQQSAAAKAFVLGSTVGVAKETFGDYYGYRMSKSAAHIAFATLAKDLQNLGIVAAVLCPGWVKTDLGGPNAHLEPTDSVRKMIDVIETFAPALNGKFVNVDGLQLDF